MTEEKAADDFAGARDDPNGEVAADRWMALGHAAVRLELAVARVVDDVIEANGSVAAKRGTEERRGAWMTETFEGRAGRAGKSEEHEGITMLIGVVVEKGAELCAGEFGGGVGDVLDDFFELKFGGNGFASFVQ